jgi:hypothetical protein
VKSNPKYHGGRLEPKCVLPTPKWECRTNRDDQAYRAWVIERLEVCELNKTIVIPEWSYKEFDFVELVMTGRSKYPELVALLNPKFKPGRRRDVILDRAEEAYRYMQQVERETFPNKTRNGKYKPPSLLGIVADFYEVDANKLYDLLNRGKKKVTAI